MRRLASTLVASLLLATPALADVGAGGDCAGGARISVYAFMQGKAVDGYSPNPVVSDLPAQTPTRPRQSRRAR